MTEPAQTPAHDCYQHLDTARHVGRATWVCPVCASDVSVAYILYLEALSPSPHAED